MGEGFFLPYLLLLCNWMIVNKVYFLVLLSIRKLEYCIFRRKIILFQPFSSMSTVNTCFFCSLRLHGFYCHPLLCHAMELPRFLNVLPIHCYFCLLASTSIGSWPIRRRVLSFEIVASQSTHMLLSSSRENFAST